MVKGSRQAAGSTAFDYDRAVIVTAALLLQAVYLVAVTLGFECDAATFYGSAKEMVAGTGGISPVRPPLFSVFLAATGTVWPGTFVVFLLAQAAMGIAIPLLIYRILSGLGRPSARIGALIVMASTTPFVGAKLVLAEHLYAFLTILAVYFLARYHDERDRRFIYGFMLSGLAALLTRWEAQFIVAFGACAIVLLSLRDWRQLRHVVAGIAMVVVVLAGYSIARASMLGDMRLVGTLQSGNGLQLFQRVYAMDPSASRYYVSHYLGQASTDERAQEPFVNPANGPASRQLRDVIAGFARQKPDSYRSLRSGLDRMVLEPDAPGEGAYQELFGRFEGKPESLADNVFHASINLRTSQYPFYVATAAKERLGLVAGDRLLLAAGIETAWKHPGTFVAMVGDGLTLAGIAIERLPDVLRSPFAAVNWRQMFTVGTGLPHYTRVEFDAAGCASSSLSPRMMAEYRLDRLWATSSFADRALSIGTWGRNAARLLCGPLVVAGWWVLLFGPRKAITLPVLITLGCLIVTIGIGVGGANTKYDIGFMPLLVIAAVSIATEAGRWVRARRARALAPTVPTAT